MVGAVVAVVVAVAVTAAVVIAVVVVAAVTVVVAFLTSQQKKKKRVRHSTRTRSFHEIHWTVILPVNELQLRTWMSTFAATSTTERTDLCILDKDENDIP